MTEDASIDPRFAPEFQRGYTNTAVDGSGSGASIADAAPGKGSTTGVRSGRDGDGDAPLGRAERRRARAGESAREIPGQRASGRLLPASPDAGVTDSPADTGPVRANSATPSPAASATASAPATSVTASPASVTASPAASVTASPAADANVAPPAFPQASASSSPSEPSSAGPGASRRRVSPWRNPWLYVIAVAGIAITVAGVTLTRWSIATMFAPNPSFDGTGGETIDYVAVQVAWVLGPTLVLLGGGTLLGALFLVATSWLVGRPLLVGAADERDIPAMFGADASDGVGVSGDGVGERGTFRPFRADDATSPTAASDAPFRR